MGNHPGRYLVRVVDACQPESLLEDPVLGKSARFQAIFLNYILDCLPATVLEVKEDQVRQLHVRTCLARGISAEDLRPWTLEQLKAKGQSSDSRDKKDLYKVFGFLSSEYAFSPVQEEIPFSDIPRRLAGGPVPFSWHFLGEIHFTQGCVYVYEANLKTSSLIKLAG